MSDDIESEPTREEVVHAIGEAIVARYFADSDSVSSLSVPLGSLSKTQLDSAIFSGLVNSGVVDVDAAPFDLALKLRITPGRVKSALFAYNLGVETSTKLDVSRVRIDLSDSNTERVVMIVGDQFTRELLLSKLNTIQVYPRRGLESARLTLTPEDFMRGMRFVYGEQEVAVLEAEYKESSKERLASMKKQSRSERRGSYLTEVFGVFLATGVQAALKAVGAA